jgi:transposase
MDAYSSTPTTDVLGRRSGPRRRRSEAEKRKIVEEALQPGASVALVARRHDLNANVLFIWRRKYLKGELGESNRPPGLIPVKMIPSDPEPVAATSSTGSTCAAPVVELKTATGIQLRITGDLAREALREIIAHVLVR